MSRDAAPPHAAGVRRAQNQARLGAQTTPAPGRPRNGPAERSRRRPERLGQEPGVLDEDRSSLVAAATVAMPVIATPRRNHLPPGKPTRREAQAGHPRRSAPRARCRRTRSGDAGHHGTQQRSASHEMTSGGSMQAHGRESTNSSASAHSVCSSLRMRSSRRSGQVRLSSSPVGTCSAGLNTRHSAELAEGASGDPRVAAGPRGVNGNGRLQPRPDPGAPGGSGHVADTVSQRFSGRSRRPSA
jgi:hypothetical protein